MEEELRAVIEKIKDIPGLKIGWIFCDPNIMYIDSEVLEYEAAKELNKKTRRRFKDWAPEKMMPVFWISDEEDDEYSPSNSLKAK